jgi:hypothetical protein
MAVNSRRIVLRKREWRRRRNGARRRDVHVIRRRPDASLGRREETPKRGECRCVIPRCIRLGSSGLRPTGVLSQPGRSVALPGRAIVSGGTRDHLMERITLE